MSEEERGKVFIKSNKPEPLVVDKDGNIYYSAKVINELENEEKQKLEQEIERLNNIINELEKYINETKLEEFEKEYGRRFGKVFTQAEVIICNMIINKLQELKGDKDNER